ncbi:MAG TPA: hypothetical protein PK990_04925 [Salinivirgaceae bacterium]|nr:hypothetical protein [Salinivirgaceae bacterium]
MKFRNLAIAILIIINSNLFSQVGIFFYPNLNSEYKHNNIVGIQEAPNTEIYLVGKASTEDYSVTIPYFGRFDKKGEPLIHKFYEKYPVWDIRGLVISKDLSVKVYGTTKQKELYRPFYLKLTPTGKIEGVSPEASIYSTIFSDFSYGDDFIIAAHTKVGENKRYNIIVHKINPLDEVYLWSTPIQTDGNEEATRVIVCSDNSAIILGKEYKNNMRNYTPIAYRVSSTGKILWRQAIAVPSNFFTQDIAQLDRSTFIYTCSYSKEYLGTSETRILELNSGGSPQKASTIPNINANGILILPGKKIMLYGSNLTMISGRVVTKAKYTIIGKNLEIEYQRELGVTDLPDSKLPTNIAKILPTTSDLVAAKILMDGRIALCGKVFMPIDIENPNPKGIDRYNAPLLIILDKFGKGI